jgi:serine/threonine-protein kinase
MPPTPEPRVLSDRYHLDRRLSRGGMGEVWRAHDLWTGRDVAVKLLREELLDDRAHAERFRREAELAGCLYHPHIVDVYGLAEGGGRLGIVMELVDGETVHDRLRRGGPMEVGEAVRIGVAVLGALEAAHAAGVVHRDVKPANILLAGDGVKVSDFGVAVLAGAASRLTETGVVLGTAHYLAPEQIRGASPSPSMDQYAAGAVLYEMLTGNPMFEADTPAAVALARLARRPIPLRERRPDVPRGVAEAIMRSVEPDPASRHGSVRGFRIALEAAMEAAQGRDVSSPPYPRHSSLGGTVAAATEPVTVACGARTAPLPVVPGAGSAGRSRPRRAWRPIAAFVALGGVAAVLAVGLALGRGDAWAPPPPMAGPSAGPLGTVAVPALVGLPETEAIARLAAADLRVGRIERVPADAEAGIVVGQDPAAAADVEASTPVALVVSEGPAERAEEDADDGRGERGRGKGGRRGGHVEDRDDD